jgi:hypothetical protein
MVKKLIEKTVEREKIVKMQARNRLYSISIFTYSVKEESVQYGGDGYRHQDCR